MHKTPAAEQAAQPTRRQARGERRIEQILATAEQVFADIGFERTTTNAIAQRAGISPGSLYQFFRNKEEIARGLAERYVVQLTETQNAAVGPPHNTAETIEQFVARAIDNMVAFNAVNPGFLALFMRADSPPGLKEAIAPLQEALTSQVHDTLTAHAHGQPDSDVAVYTLMTLQLARGVMPVIAKADEPLRSTLTGELKKALNAYLGRVLTDNHRSP